MRRPKEQGYARSLPAYLGAMFQRRDLIRYLVTKDLKTRHEMSLAGIAWWLLDPLSFMGVYYLMVSVIFNRARGIPDYPLFIFVALIPFKWFMAGSVGSTSSISANSSLIQDVAFPKAVLPVVEVGVEMVNFLIGLAIIPVFMLLYRTEPTINLFWLPVVVATQFLFMVSLSIPLSLAGVSYRDLPNVVRNILRVLFYISPALYKIETLKNLDSRVRLLIKANPLTPLFEGYRDVIRNGRRPPYLALSYVVGLSLVIGLAGLWVFKRREHDFAKVI